MKKILQSVFLSYIRILAKLQLSKIKPTIIGVTGSEGKSSTTDAIKLVLETKYKVKKTGKANSETGIPLDILGIEVKTYSIINWIKLALMAFWKFLTNWEKYDIYIVEMGIDSPFEPKNMSYLLKIIRPDIGILTSISAVHAENYIPLIKEPNLSDQKKVDLLKIEIAREKGKLIATTLKKGGNAIVNIDNKYIKNFIENEKLDVFQVSNTELENPELLRILEINNSAGGFNVKYLCEGIKYELIVSNALLGEEYAYTFGYAIQAGLLLGVDTETSIKALEAYQAPEGRFRLLEGINNSRIIDSTYNSSPLTLEKALILFNKLDSKSRKLVVLGDMRELGDIEKAEHERLAIIAARFNFDEYFLVGKNMTTYFAAQLKQERIQANKIHTFSNSLELGKKLKTSIQNNDSILAKGSQNTIFLEEAIKQILPGTTLHPSQPSDLLCRQSKWWLKTKLNYFKTNKLD